MWVMVHAWVLVEEGVMILDFSDVFGVSRFVLWWQTLRSATRMNTLDDLKRSLPLMKKRKRFVHHAYPLSTSPRARSIWTIVLPTIRSVLGASTAWKGEAGSMATRGMGETDGGLVLTMNADF